jgi:transposase
MTPDPKKTTPQGAKGRKHRNKASKTQHQINNQTHPDAGGIDIGASEIVAAVPPDRCAEPVRTFTSFTSGLRALCNWLKECGVTTAAMESTGNYWVNCYDMLEQVGIRVFLVNAGHVKGVPGKKTDVCDAQWLQQLHAAGLLNGSFRPDQEVLQLRYLVRHRDGMVAESSRLMLRIQKVLTEMNLKLQHVFSDIDGQSARDIIHAILDGQRDAEALAALRDRRCKASQEEVVAALEGDYRPEYLFVLRDLQEQLEEMRKRMARMDEEIARQVGQIGKTAQASRPEPQEPVDGAGGGNIKAKRLGKNAVVMDYRAESERFYGVDLTQIVGINNGVIVALISEIGPREKLLESFRSAGGFCAWLAVCPNNRISGGRVLGSRTRKSGNRIAAALRLAAYGLQNAKCQMGQYCRRMKGRLGKAEGITAMAHKLARIIYSMIQSGRPYDVKEAFKINPGVERKREKTLKSLAKTMGFQLVPLQQEASS